MPPRNSRRAIRHASAAPDNHVASRFAELSMLTGDGKVGARLTGDARCGGVAFTGSTEVARLINRQLAEKAGPIAALIAETGGQNALIADSSALPEQLVKDAMASAFDSAGQRCSALRLLCVQEDVAEIMIEMVAGAMAELNVGDPSLLATKAYVAGEWIDADDGSTFTVTLPFEVATEPVRANPVSPTASTQTGPRFAMAGSPLVLLASDSKRSGRGNDLLRRISPAGVVTAAATTRDVGTREPVGVAIDRQS